MLPAIPLLPRMRYKIAVSTVIAQTFGRQIQRRTSMEFSARSILATYNRTTEATFISNPRQDTKTPLISGVSKAHI